MPPLRRAQDRPGYLLEHTRRDGLFLAAMRMLDYWSMKAYRPDRKCALVPNRIIPGGLPGLVHDAASDPNPTIRLMAASACRWRTEGFRDLNALLVGQSHTVLAPLLADPVFEVRAESALRQMELDDEKILAHLPEIKAILTEAAVAGTTYFVPSCPGRRRHHRTGALRCPRRRRLAGSARLPPGRHLPPMVCPGGSRRRPHGRSDGRGPLQAESARIRLPCGRGHAQGGALSGKIARAPKLKENTLPLFPDRAQVEPAGMPPVTVGA